MCGRLSNGLTWQEIHDLLIIIYDDDYKEDWDRDKEDWDSRVEAEASINIGPTVRIPVVYLRDGKRAVRLMRWGLVPSWSKEIGTYGTHNAKSETVHEKPSFRGAWKAGRRCIVPATSFFEWKKLDAAGKNKQPYAIGMGNRQPLAFAGLWEEWTPKGGEAVLSCTIITTTPNELMAGIHDRMPVLVGDEDIGRWLGEEKVSLADAAAMLKPFDTKRMTAWKVSKDVGQVRNQGRKLLEPVAA